MANVNAPFMKKVLLHYEAKAENERTALLQGG